MGHVLEDYRNTILLQNSLVLLVLEDYKKTPLYGRGYKL